MSADDNLDGLLQSAWTDSEPQPPGERSGDRIDRYELCEEIGEGGMGSVWMAEQKEPVKRRVALKIIKLGMDTKEVVVRFEAERQALALMDHPHIAKVLDGGATESGRPYFVMELVRGTPITEYCDAAKAGLRERLELFTKVCAAVQHAHQKGIIHRDLKPGNVLVTLHDGVPVPKVIDFGIAKATSAELTQKTMFTQHAQILGTPEYMAPEQAEMSGLDIDTRADVYSLGVLLYELLTGTKPFDIRDVLEQGYQELLRTIREEDPAKPSTRVSTLGEGASPIATGRQVDVETLGKRLRGDLDWVVMKALEKDRTRRYETATGFAADIERYLREEPVTAAPPSARYRLRKFVRRRKKTVVAAGLITFLLVAGSVGTGIGWWNTSAANAKLGVALQQKNDALAEEERQRELAQKNEERALDAEAAAKERADELELVAEFQSSQLQELDPELMGIRLRRSLIDATPEERREALTESLSELNFTNLALQTLEENLLERTLAAIDTQFVDQPLVQARLLTTFAFTARDLGLRKLAEGPARRALGIHRRELGDRDARTLRSLDQLGVVLLELGLIDEAESCQREALDGFQALFEEPHPHTLEVLNNLASSLRLQGRFEESLTYVRESLSGFRELFGDEHPSTLVTIQTLALGLGMAGRHEEADALLREVLESRLRIQGETHPDALSARFNLGAHSVSMGRYDTAELHLRKAVDLYRQTLGDDHPKTLNAINGMGFLFSQSGRPQEAEPYWREALEARRRVLGNAHHDTLISVTNMGYLLSQMSRFEDAEPYCREALEGRRRALGPDHPDALDAMLHLARVLDSLGRVEEASPYLQEALERRRHLLAGADPRARETLDAASRVLDQCVRKARHQGAPVDLALALADLGSFTLEYGPFVGRDGTAAESPLTEALEILTSTDAEEALVQRVRSDLGATLVAKAWYAQAEPLLEESADWMLRHPTNPSAGRALRHVVELYDAWHAAEPERGYDRLANAWRKDLEAWTAEYGGQSE